MSNKVVKIVFTPSGIRGEVKAGTDILSAARILGADLDTVCGGNGVCARCKIRVSEGEFPKYQIKSKRDHLSTPTAVENELLTDVKIAAGFRLGCKTQLLGDVIIDIPPESQVHQQVVRKDATEIVIEAIPAVELVVVDVAEARLDTPSGDLERLRDALEFETGYTNLKFDVSTYRLLQPALRKGGWKVTLAIYEKSRVIAIWAGEQKQSYGLAIDIGSTTIAGHLCDLENGEVLATGGMMNPQIRFGEDLMSRVSYSMMNPGGDLEMTNAVRGGINQLIDQLLSQTGVERDKLLDAVLVSNPVMHHLFLGIDPLELGGAPFALATQESLQFPARELGLNLAAGARTYILPCIAGHVGADAAAVVLAEAPYKHEAITLIIDVGTNAEIILGNKDKLVAASSPTGPAFEGAQITHGQRAAPGAIEHVRIDPVTLEPRYKVIGVEAWSDETEFTKAVEETGVSGICGSGIIEAIAELFLVGVIREDGVIDAAKTAISPRVEPNGKTFAYRLVDGELGIIITQNDVRAIQLAKSTLYASVRLLMDKLGIASIERIRFAGAFGAHIDPKYAMVLGMIPDCPLAHVQAVGNAAGTGARIALVSQSARAEIEAEVRRLEKIETAIEPSFQDYFIAAMAIPHQRDAFPNLSKVVALPKRHGATDVTPGKRRRRAASRRPV
jgi:uncharacterized 2Fe-2S/4Fe-4S cluster protein (DUF4445 family)